MDDSAPLWLTRSISMFRGSASRHSFLGVTRNGKNRIFFRCISSNGLMEDLSFILKSLLDVKYFGCFFLCAVCSFMFGCQLDNNGSPYHSIEYKGNIPFELKKVLLYYKFIDKDSLKYQAAKFLIANMKYHYSQGGMGKTDTYMESWRHETDSLYYRIVKGHALADIPYDMIEKVQRDRRSLAKEIVLPEVVVDRVLKWDVEELDFKFLKEHIENVFRVWKESRHARGLTFDEFKEYILPYRSIEGHGFLYSGKYLHGLFGKYICVDSLDDIRRVVAYYNATITNLRNMNGATSRENPTGIYDLYSKGLHDCVDIASYGCNILRACGLPVVVEYNICYRHWARRHFLCSVFNSGSGGWEIFNPESSLPGDGGSFPETANIYRFTYGAQKDTPYFLKAENEYVPDALNDPCIKDVTSYLNKTVKVTIPCNVSGTNHLAYLATYHKLSGGAIPVTWGEIDYDSKSVTFSNALPNILYFPVFYPSAEMQVFGDPFYIKVVDGKVVVCPIQGIDDKLEVFPELILQRKYPIKSSMREVADNLVGGIFVGANQEDFSDAKVLLEINAPPPPYFKDYPLKRKGMYRFYKFQAPKTHSRANISMLEWITSSGYHYENTMPSTRPHILIPKDTVLLQKEKESVRLIGIKSWNAMRKFPEYDGNMQTAPKSSAITLCLQEPQMITHVRFSPLNADNGIRTGDSYELLYWHGGWRSVGVCQARYEYVTFKNVPKNKIYWLQNMDRGYEEMPFLLTEDGKQVFIYTDVIKDEILPLKECITTK